MSAVAKWHARSVRRERNEAVAEAIRVIDSAREVASWSDGELDRRLDGTGIDMAAYRASFIKRAADARKVLGAQR